LIFAVIENCTWVYFYKAVKKLQWLILKHSL